MTAALSIPPDWPREYPLEQEYSLQLPLCYTPEPFAPPPRIAVMLHAFHDDLMPEFRAYLDHIPVPADLFISSDTEDKCVALERLFADWPKGGVQTRCTPNRGRDVAPKLVGFAAAHYGYDLVLHLHTKRSAHESGLAGWRGYLLKALLGSADTVRGALEVFRQVPTLGMLAPQQIDMLRPWIRWGENFALAEALAGRMGLVLAGAEPLDFPAGSMFWARPAALRPLLDLGLGFDDFPDEAKQTDGTLAHAIERLYFFICERAGFDWMKIAPAGLLNDQRGVTEVLNPLALRRFVARVKVRLGDHPGERRDYGDHARITTLPPRPLRPPHVIWWAALGEGLDATGRIAVAGSVVEFRRPRNGVEAWSVTLASDAVAGSINKALRDGFAAGADLVLVLNEPGILHPGSLEALLQMSKAHGGRALLEMVVTPQLAPKPVEPGSFLIEWAGGPALAVPRAVFEVVGALLERPDLELVWQNYSARATAAGFGLRQCPRALFFPTSGPSGDVQERGDVDLDVLIRLEDVSELPRLDRALFTVLCQRPPLPLHVHLMTGRFSAEDLRRLRRATEPLRALSDGPTILIHNWQLPKPLYLGVPLLNWGLEVTAGRYLTVLETSDLLCAGAFETLLGPLHAGAAVVTGALVAQQVDWWADSFVAAAPPPDAGPQGAALFMLDRRQVPSHGLAFEAGETGDISGFIERLQAAKAVRLDTVIGVRQKPV